MKIRVDSVSLSSALFTVCLLALVPHNLHYISTWHERFIGETERLRVQNYLAPIGFASLGFVLVGLIVLWTGYMKRVRWTWFVMFIIVWVFIFPVYVLPVILDLRAAPRIDWSGWFWSAIKSPGIDRDYAKGPLDFLGMLIALILPIRFFLSTRLSPGADHS